MSSQALSPAGVLKKELDSKVGKFPVMEIFGPTIQGEGALAGVRTHFIRFGGCPYRCTWCDSMFAVDPKSVSENAIWGDPEGIAHQLRGLKPARWVTLSGGDPVIWDLMPLVRLIAPKYFLAVETEGAMWRDWILDCSVVTVSPKPPSSGMADKLNHNVLMHYASNPISIKVMKVVVFDERDLDFARQLHDKYKGFKFFLTPGTPQGMPDAATKWHINQRLCWLSERVLELDDMLDVVIIPQLHVLAWGTKRGV